MPLIWSLSAAQSLATGVRSARGRMCNNRSILFIEYVIIGKYIAAMKCHEKKFA